MGKVTSIIKFEGTIDGISFYKWKGKMCTRRKGGPTKKQFKDSPTMERVREHANEFKNTTKFVKLLFDSTNSFTKGIRDFQTFYRLMRIAS